MQSQSHTESARLVLCDQVTVCRPGLPLALSSADATEQA